MAQILGLDVQIRADSADEASAKLRALGQVAQGEATQGVSALDGALSSLKSSLLGIIGIGGVGELFRTMAEQGLEAHDATVLLNQSVKNLGLDLAVYREQLDRTVESTSALGLSTEAQASQALQRLILITGNVAFATQHLSTVQDLAAATGYSLEQAATLLGRAYNGVWIQLERTGLVTKEMVESGGAMDQLINKVHGASAALGEGAGEWHKWWTEIKNGLEDAGGGMLDWLARAVDLYRQLNPELAMMDAVQQRATLSLPGLTVMAGAPGAHVMPEVDIQSGDKAQIDALKAAQKYREEHPWLQGWNNRSGPAFNPANFPAFTNPDIGVDVNALLTQQTTSIGGLGAQGGQTTEDSNNRLKQLMDLWKQYQKQVEESAKVSDAMTASIGDAWSRMFQSMSNAMEKAFEGKKVGSVFKELGQSILQGFGQMFQEQGAALLQYGVIMLGLMPLLSNPFTSGPAAIAAGIALEALGAAFNAIASSNAAPGSGSSAGGAQSQVSPHGVSSTSYLLPTGGQPFAAGEKYPGLVQPVFNVIGSGDPRAQADIMTLLNKAVGRGYSVPGIAGA